MVLLSLCLVQNPCFEGFLGLSSKAQILAEGCVVFSSLVSEILPQLSLVQPPCVGFRSAASSGEPPLIFENGQESQLGAAFIPPVFMVTSVQVW